MTEEITQTERPALYVGTYAKYNNGSIAGKWLYLDEYADADEFLSACKELHKDEDDPELMFQDYENFPESFYAESMGTAGLEKLIEWSHLDADDRELMAEYADATGSNLDDVTLEQAQDAYQMTLESGNTEDQQREYGEHVIDEGLMGDIPENLASYLDYEAIGRDCLMDMYISSNGFVFYAS